MRIKNNPKIFYLACGLLAVGDTRYDHADAEVAALAGKICEASQDAALDENILAWFGASKTEQVEVNPYWPRGHAMLAATLFINDDADFNIDQFMEFTNNINMIDPIGKENFRNWISRLPEVLEYIEDNFRVFWKEYCKIIFDRTAGWAPAIEASRRPLRDFFGRDSIPNMVLAPNLFASPFSADFVRLDDTIIVIACKPDVESILHEALHAEVAKCRGSITTFGEEHGVASFADAEKMQELGYMIDDEAASIAHVIEECFVRALSSILAYGNEGRLQIHVDCGFTGLPTIAKHFEKHRPTNESLGDFIDIVLKGVVEE